MRQGGFSHSWDKWNGTEKDEFIIYTGRHPQLSEVRQCFDKGNYVVYAQIPCGGGDGLRMVQEWLAIQKQLPREEQARFGYLVYTEKREHIKEAITVLKVIRAGIRTPSVLER